MIARTHKQPIKPIQTPKEYCLILKSQIPNLSRPKNTNPLPKSSLPKPKNNQDPNPTQNPATPPQLYTHKLKATPLTPQP